MPKMYKFTEEQVEELKIARKKNKNKKVDKRLEALQLRAEGKNRNEVSTKTGFCKQYITDLTANYHKNGLGAIVDNHYPGNHRNMSFEDEAAILKGFEKAAEEGKVVETSDILKAYEEKLGRSCDKDHGRIYRVLARHGWRKVMPRSRHPKKASPEVIETSKKLTIWSKNINVKILQKREFLCSKMKRDLEESTNPATAGVSKVSGLLCHVIIYGNTVMLTVLSNLKVENRSSLFCLIATQFA